MGPILKLRGNIRIPDNRPGDQLGKHRDIGREMNQVFLRGFSPIHVHSIADDLEGIEADPDGQSNMQERKVRAGNRIEVLQKKVRILKIQEKTKTDSHRNSADIFRGPPTPIPFQQKPEAVTAQNGDRHQQNILRLSPGIEKQAGEQQHSIAEPGWSDKIGCQDQRKKII